MALEEMNKIRQAYREVYPLFRGVSNSVLADRYDMMNDYDSLYDGMDNLISGYSWPCTNDRDKYYSSYAIPNEQRC